MPRDLGRRVVFVLGVLLLPSAAGAVAVFLIGVHALRNTAMMTALLPDDLEAAIDDTDLSRAHAAIRAGADPNGLVNFRHSDLTGGQTVLLSPLVIAAAKGDENMVRMLLAHGVRLDDPVNALAPCVAAALHRHSVRVVLSLWTMRAVEKACPLLDADEPPLVQLRGGIIPRATAGGGF